MTASPPARDFTAPRKTHHWLLDVIGLVLLLILGFAAWFVAVPFHAGAILPLAIIGYAAWNVVYELTWNRHNVPTMATGFTARRLIARKFADFAAKNGGGQFHIIDLGSGRGEMSRYLARHVPNSHITGIEIAPLAHKIATWVQAKCGPANISFDCRDFGPYDCGKVDGVYMYLSGKLTREVGQKLARELKPGAVVITHTFPFDESWQPAEIVVFRNPFKERLYIYRKA